MLLQLQLPWIGELEGIVMVWEMENGISFISLRYGLHRLDLECVLNIGFIKGCYNKASRGPGVGGATQFGDESHEMVSENLARLPFRKTWEREVRTFGRWCSPCCPCMQASHCMWIDGTCQQMGAAAATTFRAKNGSSSTHYSSV